MVRPTTRRHWLASAAGVLVAAGGFMGFRRYRTKLPVDLGSIATVARKDLEIHFADSGEIAPKTGVDIASKVSGRILEMLVEEGSRVRKDDRLAVIQPGRSEAEQYVPTTIKSPIDGVVMRYQKPGGTTPEENRIARVGDYVTGLVETNQPTYLMTVADLARLIVKMKISEMDVLKLREGMGVTVTADAMPGEPIPGRVSLISPQADKDNNNLKSFKVEVSLLRPNSKLKPGMTARVDGLLDSRKQALTVPLSAVFEEGGKEVAYVGGPDGKAERVVLKLGLRNETDAEVLDGLKPGQQLLTEKPDPKKS